MRRLLTAAFLLALLLRAAPAFSQSPLVGSWELFSQTEDGKGGQSGLKQRVLMMFHPDGHVAWFIIPTERPKLAKRVAEMTREELNTEFIGIDGALDTYRVSGDKVEMKDGGASVRTMPWGHEDEIYTFRVEGDVLVFQRETEKHTKLEIRYRRMK